MSHAQIAELGTPSLPGPARKAVYRQELGDHRRLLLGKTLVTPPDDRGLAVAGKEIWLGIAPGGVTLVPPPADLVQAPRLHRGP